MRWSEFVLTLREKIEPKLIYSPFLRLIIFNVWFQLGFTAVLLTLIAAALYLPKMWRVSPPGFEPVIHVSGLDLTQAWALKRSARKFEAQGDYVRAAESLQGAVAENPADISSLRAFLENSIHLKRKDRKFINPIISQVNWLLRINHTNLNDVDLIARVCDRFQWYDFPAYLLGPIQKSSLPSSAQAVMLKGLFYQDRPDQFSEQIQKGAQLQDPELKFYRLAFQAGWSDPPNSTQALAELERASESGENSDRIGHLLLQAAAQKKQVDLYSRELERLSSRNEASAADHARYWNLLASVGRTNDAVRLAKSFAPSPESTMELIRVAQSYVALGLFDNARELLKRLAPQFGRSPEVWLAYAAVLEAKQDWDELRAAARTIRQDVGIRETLWGFSYFLEGRADLAQRRDAAARVAFDRAAESTYENEGVAAAVGRELTRLNFPKEALRIYARVEPRLQSNAEFWNGYFSAAYAAQDIDGVLKSTQHAYNLNPNDLNLLNRYAAALLITRTRPEEAIQLTLQLYNKFPQSLTAIINHSCALLLNGRAPEARTLLESVDVRRLSSTEQSPYYFSLFETYHALKMWESASRARANVVEGSLFPIQREWLREKDKSMPQAQAQKT